MPLYSYECEKCKHIADKLRKFDERDEPLKCGECESEMVRVIAKPAPHKWNTTGGTPKFYR